MKPVALVIGALLLAAACGSPQEAGSGTRTGGSPGRGPDPDAPVTSSPMPPGDDSPGPGYEVVEPRPGMMDVMPRPFERVKVSKDGRVLTVVYWSGVEPCAVLDHVEVKQGERAVTITLFEGSDPNVQNVACIEIAVKKATEVRLDRPLGGRKVVDGAA